MTALRIICSEPGRWRGGIQHTADRTWREGELTPEQLAKIAADPVFTLIPVEDDAQGGEIVGGGGVRPGAGGAEGEDGGVSRASPSAANTPEGRSGTAREAPSTGSGTSAETPSVGPQAAAPNTTIVTDTARAPRTRRKKA